MKSSGRVVSSHDVAEDFGLHGGEELRCDYSADGMPVRRRFQRENHWTGYHKNKESLHDP
jgi:hypothetical protein